MHGELFAKMDDRKPVSVSCYTATFVHKHLINQYSIMGLHYDLPRLYTINHISANKINYSFTSFYISNSTKSYDQQKATYQLI